MIYDCFIFNDEIDLLLLRLEFLSPVIDKFVIIEAEYSFSGNIKPLHFNIYKELFSRFSDKIIYDYIPYEHYIKDNAWENEYFQRRFIKTKLADIGDDDIVHITDVDEIPDLYAILEKYTIDKPYLIELPVYNYFFNLRSSRAKFKVNLITPYKYIRDFDIGNRENFKYLTNDVIGIKDINTGWHFSYLFGFNLEQYQNKLRSFSHQEFNTPYFLNAQRIMALLSLRADILERNTVFKIVNVEQELSQQLISALIKTGLNKKLFYKKPGVTFYLSFYNLKYFIKFNLKPRIKLKLQKWLPK
jgi:beta-1,4-mannosyl-glycoprotein beta-1,4-N-acetylglucosaminyltransferase